MPATICWRGLEGQQNALILQTDLLGEIAIVQRSGGLTQTAYALLSDLVTIARERDGAAATRRSPSSSATGVEALDARWSPMMVTGTVRNPRAIELVVRRVVFVDVVRRERHAFS